MKTRVITIKGSAGLREFKKRYLEIAGVSVEDEYLSRGEVLGLVTDDGEFNGGVIINTSHPFRYERYFTEEQLRDISFFKDHRDDMVEITCLWVNSGLFPTPGSRSKIQLHALMKSFLSGKKYILAGTFSEKLARIQRLGFPYKIFEGYTSYFGRPMFHWLYYGTKSSICIGVIKEVRRRFLF